MPKKLPTQMELAAMFHYEPASGKLTWRVRLDVPPKINGRYAGASAGNKRGSCVIVSVKGHGLVRAHRIIWKLLHNQEPKQIDHIDGDPHNNKLANLRPATQQQNAWNMRGHSACGLKGVSLHRQSGLWRARIRVSGVDTMLGYYKTPQAAHAAYVAAAKNHFGEFARVA